MALSTSVWERLGELLMVPRMQPPVFFSSASYAPAPPLIAVGDEGHPQPPGVVLLGGAVELDGQDAADARRPAG